MAAGAAVQVGPTSVAAAARLTVQPGAGVEWIIHNVYVPAGIAAAGVDVELYDGTNTVVVYAGLTESLLSHSFHLTNGTYLRVLNNTGGAVLLAADGVESA